MPATKIVQCDSCGRERVVGKYVLTKLCRSCTMREKQNVGANMCQREGYYTTDLLPEEEDE